MTKIIDGKNAVLGRLSSYAAKEALKGEEIIILVCVSTLISWPAAYFFMKNWLQNFAFKINPGVLTFFVASLVALVIAMITISYRTYRASIANPADSLRHE